MNTEFFHQTVDAIKAMPLLFRWLTYFWSIVPLVLTLPNLTSYGLHHILFAIIFWCMWIMMTLAIMLVTTFHREHKSLINEYVKERKAQKVTSQTLARVLQSKTAFRQLISNLPPELVNHQGLYVGAKWGRLSKYLMLAQMGIIFFSAVILPFIKRSIGF